MYLQAWPLLRFQFGFTSSFCAAPGISKVRTCVPLLVSSSSVFQMRSNASKCAFTSENRFYASALESAYKTHTKCIQSAYKARSLMKAPCKSECALLYQESALCRRKALRLRLIDISVQHLANPSRTSSLCLTRHMYITHIC